MLEDNPARNEKTGFELSSVDPDQRTDTDEFEGDYESNHFKSSHCSHHVPWFPSEFGIYHQTFEVRMVLSCCDNVKTNKSPKHAGERSDMTKKPNGDLIQMKKNESFEACKVCFRPFGRCFCSEAHAQSKKTTAYHQKKHSCCVYDPVKKLNGNGFSTRRPMTADNDMESIAVIRKLLKAPSFLNTYSIRNKCGWKSGINKFDYNPSTSSSLYENIPFVQTITETNKIEAMINKRCPYCNQSLWKCRCGNKKLRTTENYSICQRPITSCWCPRELPTEQKCVCESKGNKMDDVENEIKKTLDTAERKLSVEYPIKKEGSKVKSKDAVREKSKDTLSSKGSKEIGKKDGSKTGEIASKRRSRGDSIKSQDKMADKEAEDQIESSATDVEMEQPVDIKTTPSTEETPQPVKSKSLASSTKIEQKEEEKINVEKSEEKLEPIEEVEIDEVIEKPKTVKDVEAGNVRRRRSSSKQKIEVENKGDEEHVEEDTGDEDIIMEIPREEPIASIHEIESVPPAESKIEEENVAVPEPKIEEISDRLQEPSEHKKGEEDLCICCENAQELHEDNPPRNKGDELHICPKNKVEEEGVCTCCENTRKICQDNAAVEERNKGDAGKNTEISEEPPHKTLSTPKLEEDIPPIEEEDKGDEGKIMEISEEPPQETLSTPKLEEDIPPVEEEDKGDEGKIMEISEEKPTASTHEIERVLVDGSKIEEENIAIDESKGKDISDRLEVPSKNEVEKDKWCRCCKKARKLHEDSPSVEEQNKGDVVKNMEISGEQSTASKIEIEGVPPDEKKLEEISERLQALCENILEAKKKCKCPNNASMNDQAQNPQTNVFRFSQGHTEICIEISYDKDSPQVIDEIDKIRSDLQREGSEKLDKETELAPTSLEKLPTSRQSSRIPIQISKTTPKVRRICHCSTNTPKIESSESGLQCQIERGEKRVSIQKSEQAV